MVLAFSCNPPLVHCLDALKTFVILYICGVAVSCNKCRNLDPDEFRVEQKTDREGYQIFSSRNLRAYFSHNNPNSNKTVGFHLTAVISWAALPLGGLGNHTPKESSLHMVIHAANLDVRPSVVPDLCSKILRNLSARLGIFRDALRVNLYANFALTSVRERQATMEAPARPGSKTGQTGLCNFVFKICMFGIFCGAFLVLRSFLAKLDCLKLAEYRFAEIRKSASKLSVKVNLAAREWICACYCTRLITLYPRLNKMPAKMVSAIGVFFRNRKCNFSNWKFLVVFFLFSRVHVQAMNPPGLPGAEPTRSSPPALTPGSNSGQPLVPVDGEGEETVEERLAGMVERMEIASGSMGRAVAPLNNFPTYPKYVGQPLDEYLEFFERFAQANEYTEKKKRLVLPVLLTGHVLTIYEELPQEQRASYDLIKTALLERTSGTTDLATIAFSRLHAFRQQPGQSVDDCVASLNRIVRLAMPIRDVGVGSTALRDRVILNVFLCGLLPEILERMPPSSLDLNTAIADAKSIEARLHLRHNSVAPWLENPMQGSSVLSGGSLFTQMDRSRLLNSLQQDPTQTGPSTSRTALANSSVSLNLPLMAKVYETALEFVHRSVSETMAARNETAWLRKQLRQYNTPTCNCCGQVGHLRTYCPDRTAEALHNENNRNQPGPGLNMLSSGPMDSYFQQPQDVRETLNSFQTQETGTPQLGPVSGVEGDQDLLDSIRRIAHAIQREGTRDRIISDPLGERNLNMMQRQSPPTPLVAGPSCSIVPSTSPGQSIRLIQCPYVTGLPCIAHRVPHSAGAYNRHIRERGRGVADHPLGDNHLRQRGLAADNHPLERALNNGGRWPGNRPRYFRGLEADHHPLGRRNSENSLPANSFRGLEADHHPLGRRNSENSLPANRFRGLAADHHPLGRQLF